MRDDHISNQFYCQPFRMLVKLMLLLIMVCGVLLMVFFLLVVTEKSPRYYATTTAGEVIPIEALSSPVVTQEYLIEWAKLVVRTAYNLNFGDYEQQMKKTSTYFTPEGWKALNEALQTSGLLESVIDKKLYLSAIVNGAAVITNRYISHGSFTWEVQMPVLITYVSANMNKKQQFYVSMTIRRVPEIEEARGIAVTHFSNRFQK